MKRKYFALVIAAVLALPLVGLATAVPAQADPVPAALNATGLLPPTQTYVPLMAPYTADLPASVDLRQWSVPVGNQNPLGSCTAWAVGYSMAGWYAQKAGLNARAFAPMYLYSQLNGGRDNGAYMSSTMQTVATGGVDTQDDYMPQGLYDYTTVPTAAQKANAANWKFVGYTALFSNGNGHVATAQSLIQNALANGQPVAIGFNVRSGFDNMSSNLNIADNDTTSAIRGGHAVLAVGYDANGLLIQNSWGTSWGAQGYGRLSWNVVYVDVMEAWVTNGMAGATGSPKITTTVPSWTVAANGGSTLVSTPSNTAWTVSSAPSWVTVTPTSGFGLVTDRYAGGQTDGPVTLTASANNTGSIRTGNVVFTTSLGSPAASATVAVSQASSGGTPSLTLDVSSWSVPSASGASTAVAVTSNTSWSVSSNAAWLAVTPTSGAANGSVTLSAQANTATSSRSATVTFTTTSGTPQVTRTVSVTQPGATSTPSLTLNVSSWSVPSASAGSTPVSLTSNTSWSVSSNAAWLTVSPTSGSGNATVTLSAQANTATASRSATVTFTTTSGSPSVTQTVSVTQPGTAVVTPSLTLNLSSWSVPSASAGSTAVAVTSNTSWSVSSNAAWLTVSPTAGSANASVTLSAQANTASASRSATVTFTTTSGTPQVTRTVSVTQPGAASGSNTLTLGMSSWTAASWYSESTSVTVASNTTWSASTTASWLLFSPSTGSGNGSVMIAVQANLATTARTVTIEFRTTSGSPQVTQTLTVTQPGTATVSPSLSLSLSSWSVPSASTGSTSVSVTSNTTWSASSDAAWLTVSPASGFNNGSATLSAQANTASASRSATVTFTTTSGSPQVTRTVSVTQPGVAVVTPSLTLNLSSWSVPSASAGSTPVSVTSNTSWSVSSNAAWLTASPTAGSANGSVTLSAQANTATSARSATVTFTTTSGSPQVTRTVSVTQPAAAVVTPVLTVGLSSWTVPSASAGSTLVALTSNTTWGVSSNAAWLTVSPSSGIGDGSVSLSAQANTATTARSATVTFVTTSGSPQVTRTVSVTQPGAGASGPSLTLNTSSWTVASWYSESTSVTVSSNTTWSVTSNASWLLINTSAGSGNASVMMAVQANLSSAPRTATIQFRTTSGSPQVTQTLTVTQPGMV